MLQVATDKTVNKLSGHIVTISIAMHYFRGTRFGIVRNVLEVQIQTL